MKIIVQPQRGGIYKMLYHDGKNVRGTGLWSSTDTPRGPSRPGTG